MGTLTESTTQSASPVADIAKLFTVEEWAAMTHDAKPHPELVNGKLLKTMTTTGEHNWAVKKFLRQCDEWADNSDWKFFSEGPGIRISADTSYIPDIMAFAAGTTISGKSAYYEATPFLIVEVVSPESTRRDRNEKNLNYAAIGVQIYVIIDTDNRTVEVFRLEGAGYGTPEILNRNDVWRPAELPGLQVELSKLWFE